jgi:hypothetical protein
MVPMKCVLIVALAVLLASCRDARGASTGISANDIRTTTPVCSSSGTATEGTSVSLARADHKHGPSLLVDVCRPRDAGERDSALLLGLHRREPVRGLGYWLGGAQGERGMELR